MTETRVCDYCGVRIEAHPRDVDGLLREHKLHKHGICSVPEEVRAALGGASGPVVTLGSASKPMTRHFIAGAVEDVPRGGPCRRDHNGNSGRGGMLSACESLCKDEAGRGVRSCSVVIVWSIRCCGERMNQPLSVETSNGLQPEVMGGEAPNK